MNQCSRPCSATRPLDSSDSLKPAAILGALAPLLFGLGACAPSEQEPMAANVLVVVLDALHAGHVHHLGAERETTPNIDALAARGVSYARAFAPAPYTLASIPSLLTGRLPDRHGLVQKTFRLPDSERTLAEQLSRAGLATLGAVGNMNGSELYGLNQGFGEFYNLMRGDQARIRGEAQGIPSELHVPRAPEFVERLEEWLDLGYGSATPALFYLHMLEPHSPYQPPAEFRSLWLDPEYDGPFAGGDNDTLMGSNYGRIAVTPADIEAVRALYDANLAYADHHVGRLLEALERAGVRERTHVALTSDHGEAFWQHDRWGHNDHLYDEALRVPLVIDPAGDDHPQGLVVEQLVSTMDLFPTLSGLLGLDLPTVTLDGLDLFGGPLSDKRELLFRSHALFPDLGLRTARMKGIALQEPGAAERGEPSFLELEMYDVKGDPLELANLALIAEPGQVENTWGRIQAWRDALAADRPAPGAAGELSAAEQAMLETLGYVEEP